MLARRWLAPALLSLFWLHSLPAAPQRLIWHDPGNIAALDFGGSLDGKTQPPKAPFQFLREDASGSQPKIFARDANGTEWNVKFGIEVKPEAFCWRVVRAVGYFVEPSFYVASGKIEGLHDLRRAAASFQSDGSFREARFQYRDPHQTFLPGHAWSWRANPFAGTKELKGLKILLMLLSNWDNKDATAVRDGANTGVFESNEAWLYSFTDWGATMGHWGRDAGVTNWRCEQFQAQTEHFVTARSGRPVQFAFVGHNNNAFKSDIRPGDVAWLMQYLDRISDAQLGAGLKAAGASSQEQACFTAALRSRISQLDAVTGRRGRS